MPPCRFFLGAKLKMFYLPRLKHMRGTTDASTGLPTAIAADDGQDFARDITRAGGSGEKDEGRRDLLRLCRPPPPRIAAEFGNRFRRLVGRGERCPHRTRRHRVDADAAIDQMRR